ncbi:MAG: anthranilate synthase component I, partial [Burkholderiales bacterium]|nr:anthranilate synthase component I [Burkholderiales bacterium]
MLSITEFNTLKDQGYNRIPLTLELFADLDTPLSVYLKLANQPYTYLLESVVGGERFGRYSFIGLPARTRLKVVGNHTEVICNDEVIETHQGNPLDFIESFQQRYRAPANKMLPRFLGGLVGYFGYETIAYIEKKLASTQKPDEIGAPDIQLLLSEELVVVDNLSGGRVGLSFAPGWAPNDFVF